MQWLAKEPLTFEEINARFKAHPGVKRTISQDSFWLYLNTLKSLGCDITRPTRRNGFHYTLQFHPFTYFLSLQDISILKEVTQYLDDRIHYRDVVYFQRWLHRVFQHAANKNREELEQQFFNDSRIQDFNAYERLLGEIEQYCQLNQLLQILYQSPVSGRREIDFLPQKIFHHQGILYLFGQGADWDKSSMLRLDRIIMVSPAENPELHRLLLEKQLQKQVFIIRVLNCPRAHYEPLSDDEEVIPDPAAPGHLLVKLRTDNDFLLKQKLLAMGYQFQVLYPEAFNEEVCTTLREMKELYCV